MGRVIHVYVSDFDQLLSPNLTLTGRSLTEEEKHCLLGFGYPPFSHTPSFDPW